MTLLTAAANMPRNRAVAASMNRGSGCPMVVGSWDSQPSRDQTKKSWYKGNPSPGSVAGRGKNVLKAKSREGKSILGKDRQYKQSIGVVQAVQSISLV